MIETEPVDEKEKKKEDEVLKIKPGVGESSKFGETITIIIPEVKYKYPDFTDGYTLLQIEDFAEKHELNLQIKYKTDDSLPEDTIIEQDRAKDSDVAPGATLTITVSQKSQIVETPEDGTNSGEGETTDTETGE